MPAHHAESMPGDSHWTYRALSQPMTADVEVELTTIKRREDVNPEHGEKEYGDVEFADAVNNKYPIDTPKHIRAAWSYINRESNADKYTSDEVDTIKSWIKRAAKKHDIDIDIEAE
jgi:hypothetical protein